MFLETIIRIEDLIQITGLSKSTLYRLEKNGNFPARLQLSKNAVGWKESEIVEWIGSRQLANAINN